MIPSLIRWNSQEYITIEWILDKINVEANHGHAFIVTWRCWFIIFIILSLQVSFCIFCWVTTPSPIFWIVFPCLSLIPTHTNTPKHPLFEVPSPPPVGFEKIHPTGRLNIRSNIRPTWGLWQTKNKTKQLPGTEKLKVSPVFLDQWKVWSPLSWKMLRDLTGTGVCISMYQIVFIHITAGDRLSDLMPADLKVKTPLQNSHTQRFHRLGTRTFELKWAHWSLKQVLKGRTILYDARP